MQAQRSVLYVSPGDGDHSIVNELAENSWQLSVATDIQQARSFSQSRSFRVGIAEVVRWADMAWLEQLENLLGELSELSWILLLPEQRTSVPEQLRLKKRLLAGYCYDYHSRPVNIHDLLFTLGHAWGMAELIDGDPGLSREYPGCYGIIGDSPVMHRLYRLVGKVAGEDQPVLILGETGTGKELIARAIHSNSSRGQGPLVIVNCASLTESLIQAELFGYEKGAFTGAHQRKAGYIEVAAGGTLFLDEIGDLPLNQQANLLRFLQEHTIQRVGGHEDIKINARVIAATHVDLREAVEAGQFRSDLYYRLQVLSLALPSLRERGGDVALLARYFFHQFSRNGHYRARDFSRISLRLMASYVWPGNVRELGNRVKQAIVLSDNRLLSPEDLGLEREVVCYPPVMELAESKVAAEKLSILQALDASQHNVTQAAKFLNVSRATLYRLINKYELEERPA